MTNMGLHCARDPLRFVDQHLKCSLYRVSKIALLKHICFFWSIGEPVAVEEVSVFLKGA